MPPVFYQLRLRGTQRMALRRAGFGDRGATQGRALHPSAAAP
jgi:hypothetical protein